MNRYLIVFFIVFSNIALFATEGADYSQITKVKRIYGEYRLNQIVNTGTTSNDSTGQTYWENTKFIFMPDANNEFVITGTYRNVTDGAGHVLFSDRIAVLFENFHNCRFTLDPTHPDMKIVFRPTGPYLYENSEGNTSYQNKVMFSFKDNSDITFENLNIIADYSHLDWNTFVPGGMYVEGMIDLEEENDNILFAGNKIYGANYSTPPTDVVNMAIPGAISVGRESHTTTYITRNNKKNSNIYFYSNEIKYFRIFGINIASVDNVVIGESGSTPSNEIAHIWENTYTDSDNNIIDTWISQSAGIHVVNSDDVIIENNHIHSIYSFFDFNTDCSNVSPTGLRTTLPTDPDERICCSRNADDDGNYLCENRVSLSYRDKFQHGIYISKGNKNVNIAGNDIAYTSGAGIKASSNCAEYWEHLENVTINNNYIHFTMWFGILAGNVRGDENDNGLNITSNHIYHVGYRLYYPGYPDPEIGNISSISLVDDVCGEGSESLIDHIVLADNIIKTRHHKMFNKNNYRGSDGELSFFSAKISYDLKIELNDTQTNHNNIVRIETMPSDGNGGYSSIFPYLNLEYYNPYTLSYLTYDPSGYHSYNVSPYITGAISTQCELESFMLYKSQLFHVNPYNETTPPSYVWNYINFNGGSQYPNLFEIQYLDANGNIISCQ